MNKCIVTLLFGLNILGCADDVVLQRVCPSQCWPSVFPESLRGIGVCQPGKPVCDDEMNVIRCEFPQGLFDQDYCDGLDNDCDGEIDNGNYPSSSIQFKYYHPEWNPCHSTEGVCGTSKVSCTDGQFVCEISPHFEPIETKCDTLDNDCDGVADEELNQAEFCYDHPDFWTATNGQCRPGYKACVSGQWECKNQILPSPERCDNIDNDCNGIVDDSDGTLNEEFDIVFIIDESGSMCNYINPLVWALQNYVQQFSGTRLRFAIVVMTGGSQGIVSLEIPLGDIAQTQAALASTNCTGLGSEASLSSLHNVCDPNNPLGITWRPDATRVTLTFTDEAPQAYEPTLVALDEIVPICLQSETVNYIWSRYPNEFTSLAEDTGGKHFEIGTDQNILFDQLNEVIINLCVD